MAEVETAFPAAGQIRLAVPDVDFDQVLAFLRSVGDVAVRSDPGRFGIDRFVVEDPAFRTPGGR